ncbi:Alpha/Beta hydrolase protein [Gorgonomyces haynaldii]|nr:Alpha/Beta hydrolase protein [Gorgonomyces haynaldii]
MIFVNALQIPLAAQHHSFPGYQLRLSENTGLCDTVTDASGYLDIDKNNHLFFWFFESRNQPLEDPLILWLNGGPGCSSLLGLLGELGPCRVDPSGNFTKINPWSWNNNASIIFLDQPVNVGFSYGDEHVRTSQQAADDVYVFLQLFLNKYPQYANLDFHVMGESFAGHYIPAIGSKILDMKDLNTPIQLESLAIGNGWTDPLIQSEYYPVFVRETEYGPLLSETDVQKMEDALTICTSLLRGCYHWNNPLVCIPATLFCDDQLVSPISKQDYNVYDVRVKCTETDCDALDKSIYKWANLKHVQERLGVDKEYQGCSDQVSVDFGLSGDPSRPFTRDVSKILDAGIRVLIYAGDADYICNWIGNKQWLLQLEWSGQSDFAQAKDHTFRSTISNKTVGIWRKSKNLEFLKVSGAGHFVPTDQPLHAFEFISLWLQNKGFPK